MAKGQYLNPHQQGIVNRYYEHLDSMTAQKLGELVSDLYLAEGTAKAEKLWESAGRVLTKTPANQALDEVIPKPIKIGGFHALRLPRFDMTAYGGVLPVATMLEKLQFRELVEQPRPRPAQTN